MTVQSFSSYQFSCIYIYIYIYIFAARWLKLVTLTALTSRIGLFTADQDLKGSTSQFTRQNPQGTRNGYECPEERDYYPYFHPTGWKDIAVLANKKQDCDYYQKESFNVKPKGIVS